MSLAHRHSLRLVATAVVLCALALSASAASAGVLKRGATGARVGAVQKALGLKADRVFGPATRRAVKRFQRKHGMTRTGSSVPRRGR